MAFSVEFLNLWDFQETLWYPCNNIPTPTPAPKRGGPVACLSGPVAFRHARDSPFGKPEISLSKKQKMEHIKNIE